MELANETLCIYPPEMVQAVTFLAHTTELLVKSSSKFDFNHPFEDILALKHLLES